MSRLEEVEADISAYCSDGDTMQICCLRTLARTLAAEVDEWKEKERITSELFEAACNDLGDAQEELAAAIEYANSRDAEVDELQRRLDAVVMEHIRTAELKCYCEFDRDHERTMECEYCEEVTSLRAIAEGRTGVEENAGR